MVSTPELPQLIFLHSLKRTALIQVLFILFLKPAQGVHTTSNTAHVANLVVAAKAQPMPALANPETKAGLDCIYLVKQNPRTVQWRIRPFNCKSNLRFRENLGSLAFQRNKAPVL